jgi:hypothetical protein
VKFGWSGDGGKVGMEISNFFDWKCAAVQEGDAMKALFKILCSFVYITHRSLTVRNPVNISRKYKNHQLVLVMSFL